jgi:hypothetical protein
MDARSARPGPEGDARRAPAALVGPLVVQAVGWALYDGALEAVSAAPGVTEVDDRLEASY